MTLIDSLDSVIMLYSYAGFPERSFALFDRKYASELPHSNPNLGPPSDVEALVVSQSAVDGPPVAASSQHQAEVIPSKPHDPKKADVVEEAEVQHDVANPRERRVLSVKDNAMSNLSIVLTVMSILVAFRCV